MVNFTWLRRATFWLLPIHAMSGLGLILTDLGNHTACGFALIVLCLSQSSLLGCWCGLNCYFSPRRVLGFVLANVVLSWELACVVGHEKEFLYVLWGIALSSYICSLAYRLQVAKLTRLEKTEVTTIAGKWQYSIRQIMLLTLMVCVLLAVRGPSSQFIGDWADNGREFLLLAVFMILLGLSCHLIMLTPGAIAPRLAMILALAGYLSDLFRMAVPFHSIEIPVAMLGGDTIVLLLSLAVLRHAGYRLVRYRQTPQLLVE